MTAEPEPRRRIHDPERTRTVIVGALIDALTDVRQLGRDLASFSVTQDRHVVA